MPARTLGLINRTFLLALILFTSHFLACKNTSEPKNLRTNKEAGIESTPTAKPTSANNRVLTARIDAALGTALVYETYSEELLSKDLVLKKIAKPADCVDLSLNQNPFSKDNQSPKLKSAFARGFANADGKIDPFGQIPMIFSSFQMESKTWTWNLTTQSGSITLEVGAPPKLADVFVTIGEDRVSMWQNDMVISPDPMLSTNLSKIKVEWDPSQSPGEISRVLVILQGKSKGRSCLYAKNTGSATIESSVVQQLDGREIRILVLLEAYRVFPEQQALFAFNDWKRGLIVRQ